MAYFIEKTDEAGVKTYEATEEVVAKSELDTATNNMGEITKKYNNTITVLGESNISIDEDGQVIIEEAKDKVKEDVTEGEVVTAAVDTKKLADEIKVAVKAELLKDMASEAKAAKEHTTKLSKLMADNKLPDEYLPILEQSTDADTIAVLLGKELVKFTDSNAGNSGNAAPTVMNTFLGEIDKQLGRNVTKKKEN